MILMLVIFITSLFVSTIYFAVFMKIWSGWKKISDDSDIHSNDKVKITVVVAARNEEHTLPKLLKDLENQTYPNDLYDVILVDDHSENKISELPYIKNIPKNFIVHSLAKDDFGKKKALLLGAKISKAELLLFTDADCRLHPDWIRSHSIKFAVDKPGMTIGLVDYCPDHGLLKQFFRFDFISLIVTGAGTAYLGKHTLCNGANLAVKRDLYLNLADRLHPEIPSGDDVYLLHEIKKSSRDTISVLKSKQAIVKTQPPGNLSEFMNQRIRWASKGRFYSDIDIIILSSLVLLTNIVVALLLVLCFVHPTWVWIFLTLLFIKTVTDGLIIGSGLKYFEKSFKLWLLPVFEIIYPFYMLSAALGGILNAYKWKSRRG